MSSKERAKVTTIGVDLKGVAEELGARLQSAAPPGEPIVFALVTSMNGAVRYFSNADRADGMELLEHVVTAWKKRGADIPAHYNPDLTATTEKQAPDELAATLRAEAWKEFHRCDDAADVIEWYTERLGAFASAPARDREADRQRFPDPDFHRWLDEPITENGEFTVWDSLKSVDDAYTGWRCRPSYAQQAEPVAYTSTIGEAAEAYMDRFKPHAHPLPALFRWEELWDAMVNAAFQPAPSPGRQTGLTGPAMHEEH